MESFISHPCQANHVRPICVNRLSITTIVSKSCDPPSFFLPSPFLHHSHFPFPFSLPSHSVSTTFLPHPLSPNPFFPCPDRSPDRPFVRWPGGWLIIWIVIFWILFLQFTITWTGAYSTKSKLSFSYVTYIRKGQNIQVHIRWTSSVHFSLTEEPLG